MYILSAAMPFECCIVICMIRDSIFIKRLLSLVKRSFVCVLIGEPFIFKSLHLSVLHSHISWTFFTTRWIKNYADF